nr:MAG TPA: hypothetical protein [Caudoviricetes sp.]
MLIISKKPKLSFIGSLLLKLLIKLDLNPIESKLHNNLDS